MLTNPSQPMYDPCNLAFSHSMADSVTASARRGHSTFLRIASVMMWVVLVCSLFFRTMGKCANDLRAADPLASDPLLNRRQMILLLRPWTPAYPLGARYCSLCSSLHFPCLCAGLCHHIPSPADWGGQGRCPGGQKVPTAASPRLGCLRVCRSLQWARPPLPWCCL